MLFWIFVAVAIVALLGVHLHQVHARPKAPRVRVLDLIDGAKGRPIIVGERPHDKRAREMVRLLMVHLHRERYRTIGVAICEESLGSWRGLQEDIETVQAFDERGEDLPDLDSNRTPGQGWIGERANRHWHIQCANFYAWGIRAIDPLHHERQTSTSRHARADERMVQEILNNGGHPMLAVVPAELLPDLQKELGDKAVYAMVSDITAEQKKRPPEKTEDGEKLERLRSLALVTR